MWPFKKKFKESRRPAFPPVKEIPLEPPVKTELNIDCVFQNIISDLNVANVEDWHHRLGYTSLTNLKKNYSIFCHNSHNSYHAATISGIDTEVFSDLQQKALYNECQKMICAIDEKTNNIRQALAHERLKSLFPQCVKKA